MPRAWETGWFAAVALAALVLLALDVRLEEPRSSPVVGAEDPYTHMIFVREHVADGGFNEKSRLLGVVLYPPGMHAMVGILWVLSGVDLYALTRWFPPVFGALAAWGTFALVRRHGPTGPASALVAAALAGVLVALNPEHAVRSNLLFPTGLDLALIPWAFLGVASALHGDRRGLVVAGVLGAALVFAHPWVGFLVAGAGVFAAGATVLVRREGEVRAWDAVLVALVLTAVAMLAAQQQLRYDSDKGFSTHGFLAVAGGFAAALVFAASARGPLARLRGSMPLRAALGAAIVATTLAAWWLAHTLESELPLHVNYVRMVTWPLLAAATVGGVFLAFRPTTAGLLGLGLAGIVFPFTAFDVFDSWYLPHRSMVYLVAGAALVAGHAFGGVHSLAARTVPLPGRTLPVALAVALVAAGAGGVAAGTREPDPWGRYYEADEFVVVRGTAERLVAAEGGEVLYVMSWVPHAFVKAFGVEKEVRYSDSFFSKEPSRERELASRAGQGTVVLVLVDAHTLERAERKGWDLSFLDDWPVVDRAGDVTVHRGP